MNLTEQHTKDTLCDCNWFAVHTKRFRETLAASSIAELGLDVFLPNVKVDAFHSGPIKLSWKPLFPTYLFARFSPAAFLDLVDSARGVLYVVRSGVYPIPLDDEVVREIQTRVEEDGLIRLRHRNLLQGDRISIHSGPFAGMIGRVEAELDDRKRVAILLEALWNARVLIERQWLEFSAA